MKAFDKNVMEATFEEVGQMINSELMNSIGDLCNDANVTIGTVHFTMAYMMAQDIGEIDDPRELAIAVLSIQQYLYTAALNIHRQKRKNEAH